MITLLAKKLSIVIFADESARPIRMGIGVWLLWVCSGLLLVAGAALVFLGYNYYARNLSEREIVRLQTENNDQQQQLQMYAIEVESLRKEVRDIEVNEVRLRQLAGTSDEPVEIPVAIGGLPESEISLDAGTIERQIADLQAALAVRRQSQEEIRNVLNDKVSLSRATPHGWPTRGWLTSYFGKRVSPFSGRKAMHEGLDIAANTGTPIYATADGVVARVSYSPSYGKTVVIDHGYGYRTIFGHTSKILVKSGERIQRGDRIALVGNTGRSTGPHLHYELRLDGVPIDPRKTL